MYRTGGRLTADADIDEEEGALCVLVTVAPAESVVVTTTAATVVVVAIAAIPFDPDIGTTTVVLLTYVEPSVFDSVSTSTAADPVAFPIPVAALVSVLVTVAPFESVVVTTTTPAAPVAPGTVLVNVLPLESVPVVTRAAPATPVLAAPRSALRALSRPSTFELYTVGSAERKAGGVAAVRADSSMLLMSPDMEAAEAADWTATPKGTARVGGM